MEHRNYISLVDEIVMDAYRVVGCFPDTKQEADSMCDYLEQRIKMLCKEVKGAFSQEH